jgi:hypothetical protein
LEWCGVKNEFDVNNDGTVTLWLQYQNGERLHGTISFSSLVKLRDLDYRWYGAWMTNGMQIVARDGDRLVYLARIIKNTPEDMVCYHINGDPTDCRLTNLVNLTRSQYKLITAKAKPDSVTGVRGVTFNKKTGKFVAQPQLERQHFYLGQFDRLPDAAAAVERWYREHMPWPFNEMQQAE